MSPRDPVTVQIEGRGLEFERELPYDDGIDLMGILDADDADGETVELTVHGEGLYFERDIAETMLPKVFETILTADGPTSNETDAFVNQLSETQRAYVVALLTADGDWLTSEQLREMMERQLEEEEVEPQALGGLRRGLKHAAEEHLGEGIDETEWRGRQNAYRLKEKYREQFEHLLQ